MQPNTLTSKSPRVRLEGLVTLKGLQMTTNILGSLSIMSKVLHFILNLKALCLAAPYLHHSLASDLIIGVILLELWILSEHFEGRL